MPPIDSSPIVLILWALVGYGIGTIAFGTVVSKYFKLGNLGDIGPNHIEATDVLFIKNKPAAALAMLLEGGKGALAVVLAGQFAGADAAQVAALTAMLGHFYPVWPGFRSGKGVACFLGIWLALTWPVGVGCCIVWVIATVTTRIPAMGALATAAASTFLLVFFGYGSTLFLGILLTVLVFWRHRENIKRIKAGVEPKIGEQG